MFRGQSELSRHGNNTKVTRDDWMRVALRVLINEGVDAVRIMPMAGALGVSRSSFYWYFNDRDDLLEQLLGYWRETNTKSIIDRTMRRADTIVGGVLSVFECWVDDRIYDPRLDAAIRSWAHNSDRIQEVVVRADTERLHAIREMFLRYGYSDEDALIRARVLYCMQIGYYAVNLKESGSTRLSHLEAYLRTFTGKKPTDNELEGFRAFVGSLPAGSAGRSNRAEKSPNGSRRGKRAAAPALRTAR